MKDTTRQTNKKKIRKLWKPMKLQRFLQHVSTEEIFVSNITQFDITACELLRHNYLSKQCRALFIAVILW